MVKKIIMGLLVSLIVLPAYGCRDTNERTEIRQLSIGEKELDNERRHNRAVTDKGMITKSYVRTRGEAGRLDRVQMMENKVKNIPGIADAKMIMYRQNVIIGVRPMDKNYREQKNGLHSGTTQDRQPQNETTPEHRSRVNTDTYNDQIVKTIRNDLQTEGRGRLLYITSDQFNFKKIAQLQYKQRTNQPVHEDDYRTLINDIGFIMEPYNLVD